MRGAYCLVIRFDKTRDIQIGKLGKFHFPRGYYVYVGSAMNGLDARINRHLRPGREKKKHWHIDYLLDYARVVDVVKIPSEKKIECNIAKAFEDRGRIVAPGFGSSDCKCKSHLFYFEKRPNVEEILR